MKNKVPDENLWLAEKAHIRARADIEIAEGAKVFLGWPDRWYADWSVRCENGHVSRSVLKTENGDRCLACMARTTMTFPEDRECDPPRRLVVSCTNHAQND